MDNKPIIRTVEEIKERVYMSLGESPQQVPSLYEAWRIARDQVHKANVLVKKAIKRLGADASHFFVMLDDNCIKCNAAVTLGASDVGFSLESMLNFLEQGTKVLENKKKEMKRGTKRVAGSYPLVRKSERNSERILKNGIKETRTFIDYENGPNGIRLPRFRVTETIIDPKDFPDYETRKITEETIVDTTEKHTTREKTPTLKIQRPSLEGKNPK